MWMTLSPPFRTVFYDLLYLYPVIGFSLTLILKKIVCT